MANFQTHFTGAVVVSGIGASAALTTGLFTPGDVIILWLLGSFGGLLPDIDADDSIAIRVIFNLFGITLAFFSIFWLYQDVSILSLWGFAALTFTLTRFVLMPIFEQFTVHRATLHSITAALLFGLVTVCIADILGEAPVFAWATGLFISAGMLLHLLLDELYSVDLTNVRIKRSFGTAFKLVDTRYPWHSAAQVAGIALLLFIAPPTDELLAKIDNWPLVQSDKFQFFPKWLEQDLPNLIKQLTQ